MYLSGVETLPLLLGLFYVAAGQVAYKHTRTHIHTHIHTHTHTQTHTHTHMHTHTHINSPSHRHTHIHTHVYSKLTHILLLSLFLSRARPQTYAHIHSRAGSPSFLLPTYPLSHTNMYTYTNPTGLTRTHTHTHTRTHTYLTGLAHIEEADFLVGSPIGRIIWSFCDQTTSQVRE